MLSHFLIIFASLSVIVFLSLWIHGKSSELRNHTLGFLSNEKPFDNFQHFNDLEIIEDETSCYPFIIGPQQSDLLELTSPMIFSCNSPMKKWANFSNGILTIHEKLIEKRIRDSNPNITCAYTEIVEGEELSNGTLLVWASKNETKIEPGIPTKISLEQFAVFCRDPSGYHFYNKTWFNFERKIENLKLEQTKVTDGLMILSVSGMSHNQAMRHLKATLQFAERSDFLSFSMFNQETSNNFENSLKTFGESEKIWNFVKRTHNCLSFLHTDSTNFSKLFGSQFDFHSDLYNNFNRQHLGHVENCITDGSVTVENAIELWVNSSKALHKKFCHFSLLHLTEIAGPEDGKVVNLDEVLRDSLETLSEEGFFKNTTIVILSDGGYSNSSVFGTESGKLESKYGMLLIRLSDDFNQNFSESISALKSNVDSLVTNTDIAETLLDLMSKWNASRSISFERSLLRRSLERNRSCADAGILENSCICSRNEILNENLKEQISEELLVLVRKEISMFKCISKVYIDTASLNFRSVGSIHFFKFHGHLTTERVKLSEADGFSNSTTLKFNGKARFSMEGVLNLELRTRLKVEIIKAKEKRISDKCYHKIIKELGSH